MPDSELIGNEFPFTPRPAESEEQVQGARVQLRLATCNVLSLCGTRDEQECGINGPARQQMILQQAAEERIAILTLQETRIKRLHQLHSEDYFLYKSNATEKGHYGIIIGFAKSVPYAVCNKQPCYFKQSDFSVIHTDPRALIIRISAQALKCIVIAGHAPHTGNSLDDLHAWWLTLAGHIPKVYDSWPKVLLCDANASVGRSISDHIGGHQSGTFEAKAEPFETFICAHDLWLPATFSEYQIEPGMTWTHSSGKERRIDYVALPRAWTPTSCKAWVSDIIDPSITKTDHLAVCAEIAFDGPTFAREQYRHRKLQFPDGKNLDLSGLATVPFVPFSANVHSHAGYLQTQLVQAVYRQQEFTKQKPLKKTISNDTWQLVLQKRTHRAHLAEAHKLQRKTVLELIFVLWKDQAALVEPALIFSYDRLLAQQDVLVAQALAAFRSQGRLVTAALRRDDVRFFQALLAEGSEHLDPGSVKHFWNILRRSIPKFKQRRIHLSPLRLEALENQIVPHLSQLELGQEVLPEELVQQCHERQIAGMQQLTSATVSANSLPSLTSFETSLRLTTAGKATGLDPIPSCIPHDQAPTIARFYYALLLKMHLWCVEPLQFKGGIMTLIPKKGDLGQAANYRGILLLASVAKRIHGQLRAKLMQVLNHQRVEGQLGGFPHQMVQFGFHSVLTWTHILEKKGYSTAVLYLDLANAFHHLIRELVLGVESEEDFTEIVNTLHRAGHPLEARQAGQQLAGTLERFGCDERLLRLLRDVHTDTWLTVTQKEVVRTRRGTRPGSPLADAVFHVIMAHIMSLVRDWLLSYTLQQLLAPLSMPTLTVVWADDVAAPLAASRATDLLPMIQEVISFVDKQFTQHGFTVNYDLNKTNAVVSFQEQDVPQLRRDYLLTDRPGMTCSLDSGQSIWLHFKNSYKHLGYTYAASQSLEVELRQRIGQATSAMAMLGRPILTNRHYPTKLRIRLFRVFVETRLFYGLGTWRTPTLKQMKQLRTVYVALLKKVLRPRTTSSPYTWQDLSACRYP